MFSEKYNLLGPGSSLYGSLTVRSVTLDDTGIYTCTVSNVHESQTANALLQVQCKRKRGEKVEEGKWEKVLRKSEGKLSLFKKCVRKKGNT